MTDLYRRTTLVFGVVAIMLGVAIVIQTVRDGGGVGYVLGPLFAAVGVGRIYLLPRR